MDGKADLSKLKIDRDSSNGGTGRPGARWKWYAVLVILLAVVIFLVRWTVVSPDSPLVEIAVVTTTGGGYGSSSGGFPILTANGYVMPRIKASVGPRIASQLVELFVEEGSRVKKGDLLGRLDNRDLKARERQIEAEIESQKALLDEARANREEIRLEFERQENLIREGAVSQSNYDTAKTALKVADARVSSAEARLKNARATLEVVRAEIEKTYVRAPFDGTILRKETEIGEVVGPIYGGDQSSVESALVTMCDMSTLEVEVDVNEAYISRLREGQEASIVLDARPRDEYPGFVRKIIPTANRQKATVQVKVAFREIDEAVMPEMGAKVSFFEDNVETSEPSTTISIPSTAVRYRDGRPFVFVVEDGRILDVPVESGPAAGGEVQIYSGLAAGQRVIVSGPEDLEPGQKVRVK